MPKIFFLMVYPITLWLWAWLFAGPSVSGPVNPAFEPGGFSIRPTSSSLYDSGFYPALMGELKIRPTNDSGFYRALAFSFQQRLSETRPEKLYLQFDRTLLQPGETIWFNAWLRNAGDLKPAENSQILHVELLDPRGAVLQQKVIVAENGTAAGEFDFPATLPGGLYKINAYTNWMRNTGETFQRTIVLQKTVLPNLNLKLQFERKAFGPGDVAIARFDAMSLENKPLSGYTLHFNAQIQGAENIKGNAVTDETGRAYIRFTLPAKLESSDGLLNIQLEHQGQQEAISRAIPIVLNKIDLQFFPEGGDLIGGLPARVAFKAVNEFGKPADVEGQLFDEKGTLLASFSSFHDGMGAFRFAPRSDGRYKVRLTKPVVLEKEYYLPTVQAMGYRLNVQKQDSTGLYVDVAATRPGVVYLTGSSRDKLFFFTEITVGNITQTIKVRTENLPAGIVRLTLFDQDQFEQAERLAFVHRDRGLKIDLKPDRDKYLPRDKVRLDIRVHDYAGKPVEGTFSLAVADDKLLTYADDKQGHLLAALLLEQDVKGKIEEPNFYFDTAEPKSAEALDYLLMTQGWRRFAWRDVQGKPAVNYAYTPERTEISGTAYRTNGKPWRRAAVKLYPKGPTETTDAEGRFSFKNVDLSRYSHLEYLHGYYPISGYTQNIVLQAYNYSGGGIVRQRTEPAAGTILRGQIIDETGEPLIGATIKVMHGTEFVRGIITDYNGKYRASIQPGKYDIVVSYTGFQTCKSTGVQVLENSLNTVDIALGTGAVLEEVVITEYKNPLIEQDKTSSGQTLTADQVRNLPTRSVNTIVATTAGTTSIDGGDVKIKGARSNATNVYVDGIRVPGSPPPVQEMEQREVVIGGLPADLSSKDDAEIDIARKPSMQKEDLRSSSAKRRSAYPTITSRYTRAREFYTPKYDANDPAINRTDFRPTIYWNPSVKTNRQGKAQVEFYASDAITNFRATLEGIGADGDAGRHESRFFVQKPVGIALKTPASVISGDVLRLQIALSNHTVMPANGALDLQAPAHFTLINPVPKTIIVAPGETKTIEAEYNIGQAAKPDQTFRARFRGAETFEDVFETTIATLNRGFPVKRVISGNGMQNMFNIELNDPVKGTLSAKLTAYPSALDDVLKGMERMLRQPSGCFEQVSSSTYPNLLVLDLLRQTQTASPGTESRALGFIEDGYKKLAAYECQDGGFDWWGRSPAHEGLTAYGIMEFQDMSKVFSVDPKIIERSVNWLLSRRDGKGGWKRREDWHGWQSQGVIGAYIAWAVSEAGFGKKFSAETDSACKQALETGDPYQIALVANALMLQNDPRASSFIRLLLEKRDEKGSWTGTSHSVMGGSGDCLRIETTALAALALMKAGGQEVALAKAIDFLSKSKTEYGYGSTQSTVLALKALVEYAKTNSAAPSDGTLVVQIDGKRVAEQPFSAKNIKAFEINDLAQFFSNENPQMEVFFEHTNKAIPFDLEIQYASRQPRNARNCPLSFQTVLGQTEIATGSTVRLSAVLKNETESALASPMVVLGIPAGLTLQPWQLKQLSEQKKWDFYELWDGFAVFHFESLAAGETRRIDLDLRADIAGVFEAPASQAFLYYDNGQRVWSKPERVAVGSRQ